MTFIGEVGLVPLPRPSRSAVHKHIHGKKGSKKWHPVHLTSLDTNERETVSCRLYDFLLRLGFLPDFARCLKNLRITIWNINAVSLGFPLGASV